MCDGHRGGERERGREKDSFLCVDEYTTGRGGRDHTTGTWDLGDPGGLGGECTETTSTLQMVFPRLSPDVSPMSLSVSPVKALFSPGINHYIVVLAPEGRTPVQLSEELLVGKTVKKPNSHLLPPASQLPTTPAHTQARGWSDAGLRTGTTEQTSTFTKEKKNASVDLNARGVRCCFRPGGREAVSAYVTWRGAWKQKLRNKGESWCGVALKKGRLSNNKRIGVPAAPGAEPYVRGIRSVTEQTLRSDSSRRNQNHESTFEGGATVATRREDAEERQRRNREQRKRSEDRRRREGRLYSELIVYYSKHSSLSSRASPLSLYSSSSVSGLRPIIIRAVLTLISICLYITPSVALPHCTYCSSPRERISETTREVSYQDELLTLNMVLRGLGGSLSTYNDKK
ncbi:unnamed protein product [Danaus chrysippus]|uniref:(African queen) hypothetical protein n=1 Tax=Danaus chrysippus TaxID=151541 RepID=A0A8J2QL09_9NEOP|nr:unnamed protein product [Danaus chrysippus]